MGKRFGPFYQLLTFHFRNGQKLIIQYSIFTIQLRMIFNHRIDLLIFKMRQGGRSGGAGYIADAAAGT
jgi:hypothetical protein